MKGKGGREVGAEIFPCYSFHSAPIFHKINWFKKNKLVQKNLTWFEKNKTGAKIKP